MSRSTSPVPAGSGALPLRWVVILAAGLLAALLVGVLTFAQTAAWPATLLAALAAAGTTITALHQLVAQ